MSKQATGNGTIFGSQDYFTALSRDRIWSMLFIPVLFFSGFYVMNSESSLIFRWMGAFLWLCSSISFTFNFLRLISPEPDLIVNDEGIQPLCTLHSLDKIYWNELLDTKCLYISAPYASSFSSLILRMTPESVSAPRKRPKPWCYLHWAEPRFRFRNNLPIMAISYFDLSRAQHAVEYYYKRWQKRQKQGAELIRRIGQN